MVSHQRLLQKVKADGVRDNILAWLEDWLANRKGARHKQVFITRCNEWCSRGISAVVSTFYNDLDEGTKGVVAKVANYTN